MSGNEHVKAIRETAAQYRAANTSQDGAVTFDRAALRGMDTDMRQIIDHADALARQLAEARHYALQLEHRVMEDTGRSAHEVWGWRPAGFVPDDGAPGDTDTDPMATTITRLQREAVVRELIREARDEEEGDDTALVINWLYSRIPSDFDIGSPGDTEVER